MFDDWIAFNRIYPVQQQGASAAAGRAESSGKVTAVTGEAVAAIINGESRGSPYPSVYSIDHGVDGEGKRMGHRARQRSRVVEVDGC